MALKLQMKLRRVVESRRQAQELPDGLEAENEAHGDAKSGRGGCQAQDLPDDPEAVNLTVVVGYFDRCVVIWSCIPTY